MAFKKSILSRTSRKWDGEEDAPKKKKKKASTKKKKAPAKKKPKGMP